MQMRKHGAPKPRVRVPGQADHAIIGQYFFNSPLDHQRFRGPGHGVSISDWESFTNGLQRVTVAVPDERRARKSGSTE